MAVKKKGLALFYGTKEGRKIPHIEKTSESKYPF